MHPALLLLTDSRLPAGSHAHSGGVEQAITDGLIYDLDSVRAFLHGRLHTTGTVAAAFAATACTQAANHTTQATPSTPSADQAGPSVGPAGPSCFSGGDGGWALLQAEVDARTVSPAVRAASRLQGRLLLRVAARLWPGRVLDELAAAVQDPHHPIALGAAAHAAGASPEEAALAAGYHSITGPATAAVRLLGLDPVAVHGLLAALTPDLATVAQNHTVPTRDLAVPTRDHAVAAPDHAVSERWAALSAGSAPVLDLLAERHAVAELKLFVS